MVELGTNHAPKGLPVAQGNILPASKRGRGQPTVMTKDVLYKLETAFAFCYTDEEACLYAGISPATLYNYQKKNPEFLERKEALRLTPNLQAKKQLVEAITGSTEQARWWASHKMSSEFAPEAKLKLAGKVESEGSASTEVVRKVAAEFEEKLRGVIAEGAKKKP